MTKNDAANIIIDQPTDEDDNVQIGELVVDRVGFKDIENALVTMNQYLEQKPVILHL
jgi:hypothetical protein